MRLPHSCAAWGGLGLGPGSCDGSYTELGIPFSCSLLCEISLKLSSSHGELNQYLWPERLVSLRGLSALSCDSTHLRQNGKKKKKVETITETLPHTLLRPQGSLFPVLFTINIRVLMPPPLQLQCNFVILATPRTELAEKKEVKTKKRGYFLTRSLAYRNPFSDPLAKKRFSWGFFLYLLPLQFRDWDHPQIKARR